MPEFNVPPLRASARQCVAVDVLCVHAAKPSVHIEKALPSTMRCTGMLCHVVVQRFCRGSGPQCLVLGCSVAGYEVHWMYIGCLSVAVGVHWVVVCGLVHPTANPLSQSVT